MLSGRRPTGRLARPELTNIYIYIYMYIYGRGFAALGLSASPAQRQARHACGPAANGAPAALAFPPLAVRGKRYFVEVSTRVIAEAGLTREQVRDLIVADVGTLQKSASADPADTALTTQMRACLPLLDKAVPPLRTPDLVQCTAILSLAYEEVHGREGMTPAAQDMKTLASVLTAREREALIAAGRSGDQADQAIAEAHDAMLKEAFDEGGGVEKYDIAHCYDLAKPDQKSHY